MGPTTGIKLFDGMYDGLGNVLDLVRARHQLHASNLVNVDTPGYLAKELPFQSMLESMMDKGLSGDRVDINQEVDGSIQELPAPAFSLDGNSVDPEREATLMEQNKVMYEAIVGGMSRRLAMLRFAASDGKG